MEKLYKRLAVTFTVSAILSLMIFAVSLYFRGKSENGRYLDQLLVNVEMNLEHASEKYRENFEYQEQECLRSARSAEYIASNDTRVLEREGLEILKTLMKVKDISLIDRSGTIFLSTNDSLEGSSEDRENMAELRRNEESGEDHPGVIHVDRPMTLRINGEYQSTVIRELDSMYLMAFSGLDRVTGDIFLTFLLSKARTEAEHDRLTGLYNRNGFERRRNSFWKRNLREGLLFFLISIISNRLTTAQAIRKEIMFCRFLQNV